ncbi:DUF6395 domain-containing protein [Cupriavidus alkaliphilus]|uniref:DUF6395 domain-containing protein n=1 Tax=Cupriavidus alkaliphilus TaxID=942866 RepID=UPI00161C97C4|nr:DUF6395 domain-containing protein [Cupriavidus alkaliphilus]MBB3015429.1 hypothetical protein [Cupriavidus alkaliphilus]
MKTQWVIDGREFRLRFDLDADDPVQGSGQGTMKVGLLSNQVRITLPRTISRPHPDLMAFATLVAVRPWINSTLIVDAPVSVRFASMVKEMFQIDVLPVDHALAPRQPGHVPVVSFSGGVDSIAASEVFPDTIPYVYYKRVDHTSLLNKAPHVQVDAITDVILEIKNSGRNVQIVESDLEHICSPYPTLPHWFAIAIGALLMADDLQAGLLVMGGTLETYFMDMGRRWLGVRGKGIDPLAELVGIPICRPMLGVTEIGTMKITQESDFGDIARSCVLGTREKACGKCAKCVRKMLISATLRDGLDESHDLMSLTESDPGVKANLAPPPYYMQAQLEYCLSRITGLPPLLMQLKARLGNPETGPTDWMLSYYQPASEISIPAAWRASVEYEIYRRLPRMSEKQMESARLFSR